MDQYPPPYPPPSAAAAPARGWRRPRGREPPLTPPRGGDGSVPKWDTEAFFLEEETEERKKGLQDAIWDCASLVVMNDVTIEMMVLTLTMRIRSPADMSATKSKMKGEFRVAMN